MYHIASAATPRRSRPPPGSPTRARRAAHRSHLVTLQRAAYKTAKHCYLFGIPTRFVDARALVAGEPGITTHAECTKAFGGDHTDPGPMWPRRLFMTLVRRSFDEIVTER